MEGGEDSTGAAAAPDDMAGAATEPAVGADPDWRDLPPDWFRGAEVAMPRCKIPVSIRLDADLVDFFRSQGRGWQTKLNAVLRAYAQAVRSTKGAE
jgi:uncharacterized protein (DUF4415 family)